jgi:hypothetical protein
MNLGKLILLLAIWVLDNEMELLSTHSEASNSTTCMTVDTASVYGSEQSSFWDIHPFVYLNVVLAKKTVATSLHDGTNLLTILSIDFDSWPDTLDAECYGAVLTDGDTSLSLECLSSLLWGNVGSIFSDCRDTAFLTKAVFMLFNVSHFRAILPDNVGVRSIQECAWWGKQALAVSNLLIDLNSLVHGRLIWTEIEVYKTIMLIT